MAILKKLFKYVIHFTTAQWMTDCIVVNGPYTYITFNEQIIIWKCFIRGSVQQHKKRPNYNTLDAYHDIIAHESKWRPYT